MRVYFKEKQRFDNPLILILVILGLGSAVGVVGFGMFRQLATGEPWGDNPMSDTGLIITFLVVLAVAVFIFGLLFSLTLHTEIRQNGIRFRFPPLIRNWKEISKENIKHYEVRKYNPILEYGGWGIRVSLRKGKAYNIKGNIGLQLILTGNKKVLIGTQKGNDIGAAMDRIMNEEEEPY